MEHDMTEVKWFKQGVDLDRIGRYEEALGLYDKAIEINPQYAQAWYNKGVALDRLGKYEEALDAFDRAIKMNPRYALVRALDLVRIGKDKEALDAYDKAIEINPQYAQAWYNKGVALDRLGKYEEALDAFIQAVNAEPRYARAWNYMGIMLDRFKKYKEALNAYDKAIEEDAQYAEAWYNKGVALRRLKSYREASVAFKKAIEIEPKHVLAYSNLAKDLFNLGDLNQAASTVDKWIRLGEELPQALLLRGKIEIDKKDYARARQSFVQAISSDLGNPLPILWYAYAQYYEAEFSYQSDTKTYREEITGIIRQLERASQLLGESDKDLNAYFLYFLGCFHYKAGDIAEAHGKLKECLRQKTAAPVELAAKELLTNIWDYVIKPPWWRWWLCSPLYPWLRRVIFGIVSVVAAALLLIHPFVTTWLPAVEINWSLYIALVLLLLIILILPSVERIRAREFEIEVRSPPIELTISPSTMLTSLRDLESLPKPQAFG